MGLGSATLGAPSLYGAPYAAVLRARLCHLSLTADSDSAGPVAGDPNESWCCTPADTRDALHPRDIRRRLDRDTAGAYGGGGARRGRRATRRNRGISTNPPHKKSKRAPQDG